MRAQCLRHVQCVCNVVITLAVALSASAETFVLKNGAKIEGQVIRTDYPKVTISTAGGISVYRLREFDAKTREGHFQHVGPAQPLGIFVRDLPSGHETNQFEITSFDTNTTDITAFTVRDISLSGSVFMELVPVVTGKDKILSATAVLIDPEGGRGKAVRLSSNSRYVTPWDRIAGGTSIRCQVHLSDIRDEEAVRVIERDWMTLLKYAADSSHTEQDCKTFLKTLDGYALATNVLDESYFSEYDALDYYDLFMENLGYGFAKKDLSLGITVRMQKGGRISFTRRLPMIRKPEVLPRPRLSYIFKAMGDELIVVAFNKGMAPSSFRFRCGTLGLYLESTSFEFSEYLRIERQIPHLGQAVIDYREEGPLEITRDKHKDLTGTGTILPDGLRFKYGLLGFDPPKSNQYFLFVGVPRGIERIPETNMIRSAELDTKKEKEDDYIRIPAMATRAFRLRMHEATEKLPPGTHKLEFVMFVEPEESEGKLWQCYHCNFELKKSDKETVLENVRSGDGHGRGLYLTLESTWGCPRSPKNIVSQLKVDKQKLR